MQLKIINPFDPDPNIVLDAQKQPNTCYGNGELNLKVKNKRDYIFKQNDKVILLHFISADLEVD